MDGLAERAFLVTGAASGIGRAVAERLVRAGAGVVMVDRDADRLATVAGSLAGSSTRQPAVLALPADVADPDAVAAVVDRAVEHVGELHGAVTSAGVFDPADLVEIGDVDLDVFDRVLAVNLRGTLLVLRALLPRLGTGASVVTIASTAALRGHGLGPAYTASKGAVAALTRLAAQQYGGRGIRVNCVCPGATAGEGLGAHFQDPGVAAAVGARLPLRRVGTAAEVGATVVALLSAETAYVTGQVIAVDGGATII